MNPQDTPVSRRLKPLEICAIYGMSLSKLLRLRRMGLPTVLVGSKPRFDPEEVEAWLRGCAEKEADGEPS